MDRPRSHMGNAGWAAGRLKFWVAPMLLVVGASLGSSCGQTVGLSNPSPLLRLFVVQGLAGFGVTHGSVQVQWTTASSGEFAKWVSRGSGDASAVVFLCPARCYVADALVSFRAGKHMYHDFTLSYPTRFDMLRAVTTGTPYRHAPSLAVFGPVDRGAVDLLPEERPSRVLDLLGLTEAEAAKVAKSAGFAVTEHLVKMVSVPFLTVVKQSPQPGAVIGSKVIQLTVSF